MRKYFWAIGLCLLPFGAISYAAGTPAGTTITSSVSVSYANEAGIVSSAASNVYAFKVVEVLSVALSSDGVGAVDVVTPSVSQAVPFTLANNGNGSDRYLLSVDASIAGDAFDPVNVRVYLDNGDGVFSSASDALYLQGSNDPVLAADTTLRLYVVCDIPAGQVEDGMGRFRLSAKSGTAEDGGGGGVGHAFPGMGDSGADAVVSQAYADVDGAYQASKAATLSLDGTVLDRYGRANPIPGATITFSVNFSVAAGKSAPGSRVLDPIPAGTTYVAGSLTLDSQALTDADDSDPGRVSNGQIEVALGDVIGPAQRLVTFKVTINQP